MTVSGFGHVRQAAPAAGPARRQISRVIEGEATRDGAGVELNRLIGSSALTMLDPFLLLDRFRSDDPGDYLAGFPPHPHRGFETVTYMLAGRMRHADSVGHEGVIETGGVQWMTAGRGIVHSEMPEQQEGLLAGFQLWVNLPAAHKNDPPRYQEYPAAEIPIERRDDGIAVRVVAGQTCQGTRGPIQQPLTDPLYLDVSLATHSRFVEAVPEGHNGFVCVIEGAMDAEGLDDRPLRLQPGQLGVLARGRQVELRAAEDGARFLLIAGRPLREPVVRGGPFVMNTMAELRQAFEDYSAGRL
jgi:redox-sensitive bicupin YhaK (pirin superfamily)